MKQKQSLYSKRSNLVIGFHGCDQSVLEKVLSGQECLSPSLNDYDWLGHGIYFWENNEARALKYAKECMERPASSIKKPAIIGAVIDLGYCMDLTDSEYLDELKDAYDLLSSIHKNTGEPLPENKKTGKSSDLLIRKLDCAVIEAVHTINSRSELPPYDSVKGVFWEGKELYPNAGFREKNHIQICVRNPNCIKGFFFPRDINKKYPLP